MKRTIGTTLLAAMAVAGCSNSYGGSGGGDTTCHLKADITLQGGRIVGTATTTCAPSPLLHLLTIELENQPGGANQVFGQIADPKTSSEIPAPSVSLTIRLVCVPGNWRLKVNAKGTSAQSIPFDVTSYSKTIGPYSADDCRRS